MGKICYGKYSMGKIMLNIGNNACILRVNRSVFTDK